ncbi:MAG: hypothetical protein KDC02_09995 [Flavobacteriales bacterium]|nr:hypothetical protein [Flavobacteriales bacterium]
MRETEAKVEETSHFQPLTPTFLLLVDNFGTPKMRNCYQCPAFSTSPSRMPEWEEVGAMNTVVGPAVRSEAGPPRGCHDLPVELFIHHRSWSTDRRVGGLDYL